MLLWFFKFCLLLYGLIITFMCEIHFGLIVTKGVIPVAQFLVWQVIIHCANTISWTLCFVWLRGLCCSTSWQFLFWNTPQCSSEQQSTPAIHHGLIALAGQYTWSQQEEPSSFIVLFLTPSSLLHSHVNFMINLSVPIIYVVGIPLGISLTLLIKLGVNCVSSISPMIRDSICLYLPWLLSSESWFLI